MNSIRQPAVAGIFYPAAPSRLRQMVTDYLDTAVSAPLSYLPKAIIAPHAGYDYSGPIAASAFKPLQGRMAHISRVVLLGPAHTMAVHGVATVSASAFRSPLGDVAVDQEALEQLRPLPQVTINDKAHAREHALEVLLPFLQMMGQPLAIVPLLAGQTTAAAVAEVLENIWGGPETLILVSSDLSHYHDYATAQKLDKDTAVAIEQLQPQQLDAGRACGYLPIQGLLMRAQKERLTAVTLDCRNSGDTAGTKDRVVGYGAFSFYAEDEVLNDFDRPTD